MRAETGFQITPYPEDHPYTSDLVLPSLLNRTLPKSVFDEVEPDLVRLGTEVITSFRALGEGNRAAAPRLIQYDQWGRRVDILETSEGWRDLKKVAQREGIPGIFYERKYGEHSRTYGFVKMMLMVGDSHEIFCPMSMTDGSARVIELLGSPEMKQDILPRLISRDPSYAFTSGQWMTERPGGSDVSQTETVAASCGKDHRLGPQYTIDGFKWFSSATDSDVAVALARTGTMTDGSRGLSLFLVPMRRPLIRSPSDRIPSPTSNNIFIHRLKNKIGTHTLPTAELSLEGAEGYLIGGLNQGVKSISAVLNITRLWSAIASVGGLRKCLAIATAYSKVRLINGGQTLLKDTPLHVSQLASICILYRALTHLTFGVVRLLGRSECGVTTRDDLRRLRLLTPTVKAFTSEKACTGMEDAMSALGGAGYMEENGLDGKSEIPSLKVRSSVSLSSSVPQYPLLPFLLLTIWEGTTTVLSLDLARAARDSNNMEALLAQFLTNSWAIKWARSVIGSSPSGLNDQIRDSIQLLETGLTELGSAYTMPVAMLVPRAGIILVGYVASSVYLLEHAIWSISTDQPDRVTDVEVFKRWTLEGGLGAAIDDLKRARTGTEKRMELNSLIVYSHPTSAKL